MKKGLILFSLILIAKIGFSQDTSRVAKIDELKQYRETLFKQKLGLTADESRQFFSVYDEYLAEVKKLKKAFRNKWKNKSVDNLTDAEATEYYNDAVVLQQQELDLNKACMEKLKANLSMSKIVRIAKIESEIQTSLIERANSLKLHKSKKKKKKSDSSPKS